MMGRTTRTILLRYGGAVIFTALAVLLRWLLDPWLGDFLPFPTLYGAVAVAAWLGGYGPALLAVVLGYLACDWLFTEPRGAFDFGSARSFIGLSLYLLSCGIITGFAGAMHRAGKRAKTSANEVHSYGEQLRLEITAHQATEAALRAARDDAERRAREAEAALRSLAESESRYRTIGELIPYGVWMLDAEGRVTHLSACFLEMLGQTLEEHKKDWPSRVHPDDYERIVGGLPRWLQGEKSWDEEFRIRGKDGEYRTLLTRGLPLRDEDGRVRCWVGINLDLSKRKRAEDEVIRLNGELQRRADELQTILDILPIGVAFAHDPECRRITHNPYMSELLNTPAWANASLTAPMNERPTNFTNYRNGVEVPTSELPMQLACAGAEVRDLELDLCVQGRDPRTMLYQARPLFDERGHVRGSVGVCLDVTDHRRAEEDLRRTTEQLRIVTESMAAPVSRCSRDLNYVWVSRPNADWLGRPTQEITGRAIVDILGPEAFDRLRPHFERVLGGEVVRYEEQVPFRGIGPRWITAVYTPTFDAQGVCDGWVAVVNDIDERKRMEEALRESDRRKDEFLATLAHELRNPLAPIRNAVEVLKAKGTPDPDLTWCREVIERQVGQMARLLEDLLDVSRITRNKLELRKVRVTLASVLDSAVETSRPAVDGGEHELTVRLPSEPVYLDADPVRLAQVFANLLNNAAKYTDGGGRIRLAAERVGREVVVSVRDNGIGIAADVLPRLFEMFSQVAPALERSQGGLGIGLSRSRGWSRCTTAPSRPGAPALGVAANSSSASRSPPARSSMSRRPPTSKGCVPPDAGSSWPTTTRTPPIAWR
jgi:PAS domain S-box-containing protein